MDLDVDKIRNRMCLPPLHRPVKKAEDTGRNEPCPCGSGKKYKKCCLRAMQATGAAE